jgi:predicted nuclease of restriction endonuclease-like (RecB) superfamily
MKRKKPAENKTLSTGGPMTVVTHDDYPVFLAALKERILNARITAARAVNHELILLYWDMGRGIVEKQRTTGWGDSVIDQISRDLLAAFPGTSGFSPRNLRSIRQFHLAYSDPSFWLQLAAKLPGRKAKGQFWLQPAAKLEFGGREQFLRRLVAEIPWGHHLLILNQLSDPAARIYYLRATAQFGWSRNVLPNQIKAGAYERAVAEKKTYNFALALPEYLAEQADVNLLNDQERAPDDQPSIGIILCAKKDDVEVEFALKTKHNPIGVAEYQLQTHLPAQFNGRLPTAKQ